MSRPRVLLATCAAMPDSDKDDVGVLPALAEVGVDAAFAPWDDPSADFAGADLVVLRATWDYTLRRKEFLAWCDAVPRLANRADLVRWNTDKSYLADLASDGLAVVPTELVPPGAVPDWPDVDVVVKPAVGAGSHGARRFAPDQREEAASHLADLHTDGGVALVQPYQPAVDAEGETALVYLGGVYSHSFHKGPMLGNRVDPSGLFLAERLGPTTPTAEQRVLAEDTLDAVCARFGMRRNELVYARVDVLRGADGRQLLLELELTEPSLGFRQTGPEAPARFASAVRSALAAR
ncbi:ATP-grasp domain [Streptoalloteichus tenebrarius]|uniref:ATP-grasp domain n=1 Tax=Streptoalloteichus tenebrarius (strain ATCC 17920 / DSM 40477 / JCM 4838 / CBS 697.72 / NBRC 16177 / NCIMB 11028 / NRRL B-12390 / A12253. 1 / ISP 5477) TaxID=1933 RepID=A0ABT1HST7_STRSD|nr:hypothetical protein [Streptoalloteichus tenebrarius]MCP2258574.1 ATP-grasp domain [Streptoalloteichus tenebrarius]BFF04056.1 hypothetical protein GCM10020241_57310 [Streptoalloteichus tenebrarius]